MNFQYFSSASSSKPMSSRLACSSSSNCSLRVLIKGPSLSAAMEAFFSAASRYQFSVKLRAFKTNSKD